MPLFAEATITMPAMKAKNVVASNVTLGVTPLVLLTANTDTRLGASLYNATTANLYIDWNPTVSPTDCSVKIPPGGYYETAFNPDEILYGVLETGEGTVCVREFTE